VLHQSDAGFTGFDAGQAVQFAGLVIAPDDPFTALLGTLGASRDAGSLGGDIGGRSIRRKKG
jgi:hypothetical protein